MKMQTIPPQNMTSREIVRGTVEAVLEYDIVVALEGDRKVFCDVLQVSEVAPLQCRVGDAVLLWRPAGEESRGVVFGRVIEPGRKCDDADEIVIKARNNLTIECGEGSITLRGDGKVLIKGKDLVSRAQRMNRIKGGSVALN